MPSAEPTPYTAAVMETAAWREKRGELEPENLSGNLVVEPGTATEELDRRWHERNTSRAVGGVQNRLRHPVLRWKPGKRRGASSNEIPWKSRSAFQCRKYADVLALSI
jgi:hypothetical protein